MWHEFNYLKQADSKEITAAVRVPLESPWFCGHFPGKPILPGIAQLGMVFEAINEFANHNLTIAAINRVRFRQMIRPDQQLRIIATPSATKPEPICFASWLKKKWPAVA
jgi:3-hydroxyacyl-[acyl-carrier-protein] dehydratase